MKPFSTLLAGLLLVVAGPALADAATLQLTPGKVFTDAAGAYVSVAVKNTGSATVAEAYVTCEFFAGSRSLGKSSTTLFSIVGGVTGTDQVRLLGGTSAKSAKCAITGQK
ncbi:hypothetical protein V5F59_14000 [Xanthobacter autotrophicus DSM 431]|uniref:hypothetical protein n=1 Tax=Xanthobacter nonsaccharivorans TaxID=3119912 RepID=UPI003727B035